MVWAILGPILVFSFILMWSQRSQCHPPRALFKLGSPPKEQGSAVSLVQPWQQSVLHPSCLATSGELNDRNRPGKKRRHPAPSRGARGSERERILSAGNGRRSPVLGPCKTGNLDMTKWEGCRLLPIRPLKSKNTPRNWMRFGLKSQTDPDRLDSERRRF